MSIDSWTIAYEPQAAYASYRILRETGGASELVAEFVNASDARQTVEDHNLRLKRQQHRRAIDIARGKP